VFPARHERLRIEPIACATTEALRRPQDRYEGRLHVYDRITDPDVPELAGRSCTTAHGLTELEDAWLVRSLYREDGMSQPEIARRLHHDKTWVWRWLMLVEALDPLVQADVRLGPCPRAAVAVSRLPRGNQQAASAVGPSAAA
jgi:hypothetical protein